MPIARCSNPRDRSTARRGRGLLLPIALLALGIALGVPALAQPPPEPPPPPEVDEQQAAAEDELEQELDRRREQVDEALDRVGRELRRARERRHASDARVSIGGNVRIDANQVAEDVVAVFGSITADGDIDGDAVAVLGSVEINGLVDGDVVAVLGGVTLGPEAEVRGDVTSVGGRVDRAQGAEVAGSIAEVAFAPDLDFGDWGSDWDLWGGWSPFRFFDFMSVVWAIIGLVILVLVASLIVLVAPQAVARVEACAVSEPWKSGLVGLAVQVLFIPVLVVVCVILAISIVGIPLLLLVPFAVLALFIAALVGYTGSALGVGHVVDRRFGLRQSSPFLVVLIGVALIQSFSLIGDVLDLGGGFIWLFAVMFGLFGFLIKYLAWTVGLGAVVLTRLGTVGPSAAALPPLPPPAGDDDSARPPEFESQPLSPTSD